MKFSDATGLAVKSDVTKSFLQQLTVGWKDACILIFCSALLILCVSPFMSNALWTDEIFSVVTARSIPDMFAMFRNDENNMVLYYFLLHSWMTIFGESETAVRSLSILFAILSILPAYFLMRKFYDRTEAFMFCILLVTNAVFLNLAIEARGYAMMNFFCLLASFIFLKLIEQPGITLLIAYSLVVSVAIYTHYFAVFIVFSHCLYLVISGWKKWYFRYFAIAAALVILMISPLFIWRPHSFQQIAWISKPEFKYIFTVLSRLAGHKLIFITEVCVAVWLVVKVAKTRSKIRNVSSSLGAMAMLIVIIPVIAVYIVSVTLQPLMQMRYFGFAVPYAVMLSVITIYSLTSRPLVVYALFFTFLALQLYQSYPVLTSTGSGYRAATMFVQQNAQPGDAVICYPFLKATHFEFYSRKLISEKEKLHPIDYSKHSYYKGGGRRDPDPDMDQLSRISGVSKKIFIICRSSENQMDSIQNRIWLPTIEAAIKKQHPVFTERIFLTGSEEPIRVLVYK